MSKAGTAVTVSALRNAEGELRSMLLLMETEIAGVVRAFEGLALHTDSILNLAAAIVGCVENENISSVLPRVETMGTTAKNFVGERLQATSGVLETVATQVNLLRELSQLTSGQTAIALETKALSVLTNIEAARLGAVGAGFQYLAHELADFSHSLTSDTQELAAQTHSRRAAIEQTRAVLSTELPRLREKLGRVETDLNTDLAMLNSGLAQLSSTPVRFRSSVEDISRQITGVVVAVQAHDITRQQIEHVQQAFAQIAGSLCGDAAPVAPGDREIPRAYAGITIQIYQLKNTRETVSGWTSQIKTCVGILSVSASEVMGIGPMLEREQEVSAQLGHIERLEGESQEYCAKIQQTLGGLSSLMQLVSEHMKKSKAVRNRLRMLSFNSIIEASLLGSQAGAILAIAKSIKEISAEWSKITDRSESTMQEILELVTEMDKVMEVFSDAGTEKLREAQAQTVTGIESLRAAGAFAADQAQAMNSVTRQMQIQGERDGKIADRLDTCLGRVDAVLNDMERMKSRLEIDYPKIKEQYDMCEVEELFSASYTTEIERDILRAALRGSPIPVAQHTFAGNSVELF